MKKEAYNAVSELKHVGVAEQQNNVANVINDVEIKLEK